MSHQDYQRNRIGSAIAAAEARGFAKARAVVEALVEKGWDHGPMILEALDRADPAQQAERQLRVKAALERAERQLRVNPPEANEAERQLRENEAALERAERGSERIDTALKAASRVQAHAHHYKMVQGGMRCDCGKQL